MRNVIRGIKISTALLIAIAIVDVALVVTVLVRHGSLPAGSREQAAPVAESVDASAQPRPAAPPESPYRAEWMVDVISPTAALRGRTGDCASGAALVQVTRDRGRTWEDMPTTPTAVLRVKFVDESTLWLVGTREDCEADFLASVDGGESWGTTESTSLTWHLLSDAGSGKLHGPGGNVASPCDEATPLVDISGVTVPVGYALCADGGLYRSEDRGAHWKQVGMVAGGWATAFPTTDVGYAATRRPDDCAGVSLLRTTDAGRHWEATGCVEGVPQATGIALSFTKGGAGVLVSGTSTWWTGDGGRTWSAAS